MGKNRDGSHTARRVLLVLLKRRFRKFLHHGHSKMTLACLRIGICAVLLLQAAMILPEFFELYSDQGFLHDRLNDFLVSRQIPTFMEWWVVKHSLPVPATLLSAGLFSLYIAATVLLLMGWRTRLSAFMCWLTHFVLFFHQGYLSSYGVDSFAHVFLFYLIWVPSNEALSIDSRQGRIAKHADFWRGPSIRLLQFHLAFAYFSSGILKAMGAQWRNGEVIWRALNLPQFSNFDMTWMAQYPVLPLAIALSTLALEIGYPVLMFSRRLRLFGVFGIIGMHAGIAISMGLWSFSLMMIALSGCLFGLPWLQQSGFTIRRVGGGFRLWPLRVPASGSAGHIS